MSKEKAIMPAQDQTRSESLSPVDLALVVRLGQEAETRTSENATPEASQIKDGSP